MDLPIDGHHKPSRILIQDDVVKIYKLHETPQYLDMTIDLLNAEWPRSKTARRVALERSRDELPLHLILVSGRKTVIGHVKLAHDLPIGQAAFLESLLVTPNERGRGFGSLLLKACEQEVATRQIHLLRLTTIDKLEFYSKHGYQIDKPFTMPKQRIDIIGPPQPTAKDRQDDKILGLPLPPPLPQTESKLGISTQPVKVLMYKML